MGKHWNGGYKAQHYSMADGSIHTDNENWLLKGLWYIYGGSNKVSNYINGNPSSLSTERLRWTQNLNSHPQQPSSVPNVLQYAYLDLKVVFTFFWNNDFYCL